MSESYTDCFFKEHSSCQWYWHGMVCVSALNCWLNTFSVFSTLQFWDYFHFICVEEKRNVRDHVCFLYPIIAGSYDTHVWKKVMRHETALFSHHAMPWTDMKSCVVCSWDMLQKQKGSWSMHFFIDCPDAGNGKKGMFYFPRIPLEEEYKKLMFPS